MTNDKQQTAVEWLDSKIKQLEFWVETKQITWKEYHKEKDKLLEQAKEMEKEQMRLDIEKKWEQYRIITNNEDAWSFKEWLIKQTYGGNK